MAAMKNKNAHLNHEERQHIEIGIKNGAIKKSIADTLGKDKSTICKETKLQRSLDFRCKYPIDCISYQKCKQKHLGQCDKQDNYKPFSCTRRDRSPGACNGCDIYRSCYYDKYYYHADLADKEY